MPNIYSGDLNHGGSLQNELTGKVSAKRLADFEGMGVAYVMLICGQWYEWALGLPKPWIGFNIRVREVTFFDDGETGVNFSTWDQCGRAVAAMKTGQRTGFTTALYARAFFLHDSNIEPEHKVANGVLALPQKNQDEMTKLTVKMIDNGFVEATFKAFSA